MRLDVAQWRALLRPGDVVVVVLGLVVCAYAVLSLWQGGAPDGAVVRAGGRVVYLHASVEQQLERTSRDRNRPLLRNAEPGKVLRNLMEIRDPLYREIADIIIETDERPPRLVVQEIIDRLKALPPR